MSVSVVRVAFAGIKYSKHTSAQCLSNVNDQHGAWLGPSLKIEQALTDYPLASRHVSSAWNLQLVWTLMHGNYEK